MAKLTIAELFARNVRRVLDATGVSQAELARRLSASPSNVSRALTGTHTPDGNTISEYAAALGCEPHELIAPVVEEKPKPKKK